MLETCISGRREYLVCCFPLRNFYVNTIYNHSDIVVYTRKRFDAPRSFPAGDQGANPILSSRPPPTPLPRCRRRRSPPGKALALPAAADLLVPAREEDSAGRSRSGGGELQRRVGELLARWAGEPRPRRPLVVETAELCGACVVADSFFRDLGQQLTLRGDGASGKSGRRWAAA
jgi:hypothetical protein